jgi:hypothetical protein
MPLAATVVSGSEAINCFAATAATSLGAGRVALMRLSTELWLTPLSLVFESSWMPIGRVTEPAMGAKFPIGNLEEPSGAKLEAPTLSK